MTEVVTSRNGVSIRLTDEHAELAGRRLDVLEAVSDAERIVAGTAGEMLALRIQPDGKTLVTVYREDLDDGFIITAFLTRRAATLNRRKQLWP